MSMSISIYIAHRRKNASNVLNVPSTDQKETSSVYDENSQFACPAQANCFGTSSMSLVQRQRRCDGRTYRAETSRRRLAERTCVMSVCQSHLSVMWCPWNTLSNAVAACVRERCVISWCKTGLTSHIQLNWAISAASHARWRQLQSL